MESEIKMNKWTLLSTLMLILCGLMIGVIGVSVNEVQAETRTQEAVIVAQAQSGGLIVGGETVINEIAVVVGVLALIFFGGGIGYLLNRAIDQIPSESLTDILTEFRFGLSDALREAWGRVGVAVDDSPGRYDDVAYDLADIPVEKIIAYLRQNKYEVVDKSVMETARELYDLPPQEKREGDGSDDEAAPNV